MLNLQYLSMETNDIRNSTKGQMYKENLQGNTKEQTPQEPCL